MVHSLRGRNLVSTPIKKTRNRFLDVVLNALNVGRETCATINDDDHATIGLSSTRIEKPRKRYTRFIISEVIEESSPSSQSTTITMLSRSSASSDCPSMMITPTLSSTVAPSPHVENISEEHMDIANKSTFFLTLGACIDDIILEHSIPRKGVSIYVIKKYLEEKYCYNSWHYRKSIRNYVVESLASGHLEQVSGRGANGSVRLSQRQKRTIMRAKLQSDSISIVKAKNKQANPRRTMNLSNLTEVRLKRRLTTAKRKSLYINTTLKQSNTSSYSSSLVPSQIY